MTLNTTDRTDRRPEFETVRDDQGNLLSMSDLDLLDDELQRNEERCCRTGDIVAGLIKAQIARLRTQSS